NFDELTRRERQVRQAKAGKLTAFLDGTTVLPRRDIVIHVQGDEWPWLVAHDLIVRDTDKPFVASCDAAKMVAPGGDATERQRTRIPSCAARTVGDANADAGRLITAIAHGPA